MKTLVLTVASASLIAAGALTGCERALPSGITQQGGNAPLVIDLDAAVGSQSTNGGIVLGKELRFTVRGANKGHGEVGGATVTFVGDGNPVCVILDPEDVWTVPSPTSNANTAHSGDADLYAGFTSDYTGTAGLRIGDFNGVYVDPLGVSHPLDNNQCIQYDLFGNTGAHAGFGAPEFCGIQTVVGKSYTVLAQTFAVPEDDDLLTEAIRVDTDPGNIECGIFNSDGTVAQLPAVSENTLTSDNNVPKGFNDPPAYP